MLVFESFVRNHLGIWGWGGQEGATEAGGNDRTCQVNEANNDARLNTENPREK